MALIRFQFVPDALEQENTNYMGEQNRDAAVALFEDNKELAYWVLHRHFPALAFDDDIRQEALIGLWKGCLKFDPSKSKPATFLVKCIQNSVLMSLRKKQLEYPMSDLGLSGELLLMRQSENDPGFKLVEFEEFIGHLTEKQQLVVRARANDMSQEQIAEMLGLSQSYCSRLLSKLKQEWYSID